MNWQLRTHCSAKNRIRELYIFIIITKKIKNEQISFKICTVEPFLSIVKFPIEYMDNVKPNIISVYSFLPLKSLLN
jgi:hypothetical protein